MSTIEEIETAISSLPRDDFFRLHAWVQKRFEDAWDRQITADMESGRLDRFAKAALDEHRAGRSAPFPPDGE